MKKITVLIFLIANSVLVFGQAPISIPTAPSKVEFVNVMVELNNEAQALVNTEITNILTPQNKFLEAKLERIQWYLPIIEKILEEENIPDDFKYISIMESSLLPEAVSSSNAVGFWQFKEGTAKDVNMKIDNFQDDRKNIYHSTKGAALYFKKNNLVLKNWVSTILSFYLGLEGSSKVLPYEWSFASDIKFDEKTNPYLIKALATRIAIEHRINRIKESPKKFLEYPGNNKSFAEIAVELSTDLNELRKYNTWLSAANIPNDKAYKVLILTDKENLGSFENRIKKRTDLITGNSGFPELKRITNTATSPDMPIIYEINGRKGILSQPGDQFEFLAKKGKKKLKTFLSNNDLKETDVVKEGKVYYLQKKNKKAKVPFHTLSPGQSLWDVSQMYGVKEKCISKYNRLEKNEKLQTGRVVWLQKTRPKTTAIEYIREVIPNQIPAIGETIEPIAKKEVKESEQPKKETSEIVKTETSKPKSKTEPLKEDDPIFTPSTPVKSKTVETKTEPEILQSSSSRTISHTVKNGETVFSIAKKYNLSTDELRSLNNLSSNQALKIDQILVVSKRKISEPIAEKPEVTTVEPEPEKVVIKTPEKKKSEPVISEDVSPNTESSHRVLAGETMFSISKKYGMTVKDLQGLNGMKDNTISVGQYLVVTKKTKIAPVFTERKSEPIVEKKPVVITEKPVGSSAKYHTVKAGETMYSISKLYSAKIEDIKRWNNLPDNNVKLGSSIIVKK